MNNNDYDILVGKISPEEPKLKNAIISFLVGGLMGFFAELLVKIYMCFGLGYDIATSVMSVTFIFVASLLTGLGIFDDFVSKYKCGLIIPITGFAHSITSSMMEYKHEGLVTGIGSNAFKLAGSVILYGVVSAYVFAILRYFIGD